MLCSLLGFGGGFWWLLDLAAHFRLQYLLVAVVLLLWSAWRRQKLAIWLAAACLLLNLVWVLPLYFKVRPLAASQAASQAESQAEKQSLRILLANVHTSNPDKQRLLELVHKEDPDLLALQEIDTAWVTALQPLSAAYPHQLVRPRSDNFGIGLWSKRPLAAAELRFWGEAIIPSIQARLLLQGKTWNLLLTHPLPPLGASNTGWRDGQLAELAKVARDLGPRTLLLGDLNTSMYAGVFKNLVRDSGLLDSSQGFGPQPSWPAGLPWLLRIPIDHCLHSPDLQVLRRSLGPDIGSDHLPVLLELSEPH